MIRVLVVDDQELVRSGFTIILDSADDIEVVGEAANGREGVDLARELRPDVICMDIEMPELSGIDATREVMTASEGVSDWSPSVLMLTTFGHETYLFDALAAGAIGFLLKTARAEQLIDSVRTIAAGGAVLSPEVTQSVIQRATELPTPMVTGAVTHNAVDTAESAVADDQTTPDHALEAAITAANLTERETDVLLLVAQGKSNGEIAQELFVGEATVKTHLSNLLQKIGARDRIQAVVWAHTRGSE